MSEQPNTIRSLFLRGESERRKLEQSWEPNTPAFQEQLGATIRTYEKCLELSEQASLFSPNESLEDVSSTDLPYMTVPFYIAELLQKITGDISARKVNLLKAQELYEQFLKLLDSYEILSKTDAKLLEAYLENRNKFEVITKKDAGARRDAKIAQFKAEKELKQKLEYLQQNPKLAENDEQAVRDLNLTDLAFKIQQTFKQLEFIGLELHMISMAPPPPPPGQSAPSLDDRQSSRRTGDAYSDRLDSNVPGLKYSGPLLSSDGKPLRPFTLTDKRQQLRQGVFRPDHSLPTMSIDDYLEEERKRGGIIEGGGEQSGIRPEIDEDDLNKADEETMKARAWDEFTEENPKGAGNTFNRG